MNYILEHARQLKTDWEPISRRLGHPRDAGNRPTGGGLRSLAKRLVQKSLRHAYEPTTSEGGRPQPVAAVPGLLGAPSPPRHRARPRGRKIDESAINQGCQGILVATGEIDIFLAQPVSGSTSPTSCNLERRNPTRVPRDARIIEIGPSYNPIAPKAEALEYENAGPTQPASD
jgi:hypothetical protein